MNWDCLNHFLVTAARIVVGLIFLYAGVTKFLSDPAGPTMFTDFFPRGSIGGYVAAAGEALLGLWLISGILRGWSAGVAIVALVAFSGLIVREMQKPNPNPCGCIREVLPGDPGTGDVLIDHNAVVRRQLRISLGRNLAMIGCAAMTLLASGSARRGEATIPSGQADIKGRPESPAEGS